MRDLVQRVRQEENLRLVSAINSKPVPVGGDCKARCIDLMRSAFGWGGVPAETVDRAVVRKLILLRRRPFY